MISHIFTALLAAACIATPVAATDIDLSEVKIQSITHGGSGCPQNPPTSLSINGSAVGIVETFTQLNAASGVNASVAYMRQNCQANFNIVYPAGVQYRIKDATIINFAKIPKGVSATNRLTIYFSGSSDQIAVENKYTGPVFSDAIPYTHKFSNTLWSPCNNPLPLNINTVARMDDSYSQEANLGIKYVIVSLDWQRC